MWAGSRVSLRSLCRSASSRRAWASRAEPVSRASSASSSAEPSRRWPCLMRWSANESGRKARVSTRHAPARPVSRFRFSTNTRTEPSSDFSAGLAFGCAGSGVASDAGFGVGCGEGCEAGSAVGCARASRSSSLMRAMVSASAVRAAGTPMASVAARRRKTSVAASNLSMSGDFRRYWPRCAAESMSSMACASLTPRSNVTMRAAPLREWAARISGSMAAGLWSASALTRPASSTRAWVSSSMWKRSSMNGSSA